MSRDDELEEQAEGAGYGGATEGVGAGTPPQEQQQPHLEEAQRAEEDEEARTGPEDSEGEPRRGG